MKRTLLATTIASIVSALAYAPFASALTVSFDGGGVLNDGPTDTALGESLGLELASHFAFDEPGKVAANVASALGYTPPSEVTIELEDAGIGEGGLDVALTATPLQFNGEFVQANTFPLPYAPAVPGDGWEFVQFTPSMFAPPAGNRGFFSYNFSWWLAGDPTVTADMLSSYLLTYYQAVDNGCVGQVGPCNLANITSSFVELPEVNGARDVQTFMGEVTLYDYVAFTADLVTLHILVHTFDCAKDGHRLVNFVISPEPYSNAIWPSLLYQQAAFTTCN